jgi:hypothetical protein
MVGKDTVFRYTRPEMGGGNVSGNTVKVVDGTPLKEGYIVIQAESAPVLFRKIDLLDLVGCMDKARAAYRSYFVKNDPKACEAASAVAGRAPEVRFGLRREGARIRVTGEGALLTEVRRADGRVAARFPRGSGSFAPDRPGVYLLTARTPEGTAARAFAFF